VRLRLIPREERFFDLFVEDAANVLGGARQLEAMLRTYDQPDARAAEIRATEHRGDEISHEIGHRLEATFVTPFDREDIYQLITQLDDVMDAIEAAADFAVLVELETLPAEMGRQVDLLQRAARCTVAAMGRLATMDDLASFWIEINRLENEADQVYRGLLSRLFSGTYEALTVLKLKQVADDLEEAADAFEHVANVVQTIAVKES
jgi:uncharacterized protein